METKNESKKMTMDKLAGMMQREFGTVKKEITELKSEMGELKGEVNELKEETREKFDLVFNSQDKILKRLDDLETDNAMSAGASRRHEDKLENHEERIIAVEEKLGIGEAV